MVFFRSVESLCIMFAKYTQRWKKLKDFITFTEKCDTRSNAKFNAEKAVHFSLNELVDLLKTMSVYTKETSATRGDAQRLLQNIISSTSLRFWHFCTIYKRVQNRL